MTTATEIDAAMRGIKKVFGNDAIQRLGDPPEHHLHIPTGIPSVDAALGIGGLAQGRVIEIFGEPGSGRTTLVLHVIANAQKAGMCVALIDTVHELVPQRAKNIGVDMSALLVSQPDNGEQALEIADRLVRSGAVGLVVVDDSLALTPRGVIEGDYTSDQDLGLRSRLLNQALRKLTAAASRNSTTVVFVSTLVPRLGVSFGDPLSTPGNQALKFYSSVRIKVRRVGALMTGEMVVGQRVEIRIIKNKLAAPFRVAEPLLVFDHGLADVCSCDEPPEEPGITLFCTRCWMFRMDRLKVEE